MIDSELAQSQAAIASVAMRLRQLTQQDVQQHWRIYADDLEHPALDRAMATHAPTWHDWQPAILNDRRHIAWAKGRRILWLGQQITVPERLERYPLTGLTLRLALTWWAEQAQIFVNGALVQEGDLFDCSTRILLGTEVVAGSTFDIAICLESPGHDDGALVRSQCIYENAYPHSDLPSDLAPEPGFVADELTVLQRYLTQFAPQKLDGLIAAIAEIDWAALPDRPAFDRSIAHVRQSLQPLSAWIKQRCIQSLGHAHLDLAWLWTVDETWKAAERTFRSALNLQQEFPELIFCHSTPALYAWLEDNRPDLFAAVQRQVAQGRWEIVAGLWVEPDLNLISGESIVRQVLYGQRYVREKFGQVNAIAWLPDTFGFCWQLPQILRQGGVRYFVTQKLRWNDTTKFPHAAFWWRSPDGTQIFSLHSALIGESIDPVKMADYACEWEAQTQQKTALWLPGVGDHGGGPTRDMLEVFRRWQQSPLCPRLEFTTALNFLETVEQSIAEDLPIWNNELYLELHRGCYTTHADQKRYNRRLEDLLYQAELFSAIATLTSGTDYPKAELERTWKQVLFNQFHDILPGSAIPEVFEDANRVWIEAAQAGQRLLDAALETIAAQIRLPDPPVPNCQPLIVVNSLNWRRSQVVSLRLSDSNQSGRVYSLDGTPLQTQLITEGNRCELLFEAVDIPAIGYRLFWLCRSPEPELSKSPLKAILREPDPWMLRNEWLEVAIDPQTGDLIRVFDRINQREVLSAPGNQLQAFQDSGQYWDAWNIDPNYQQHPLPPARLIRIQGLENGEIRQRLRVVRQIGQSEFCQDYILDIHSPLLRISSMVNWQDRHVIVKAAFPLTIESDDAIYEIPFAAIDRSTRPVEPHDKAKWEVPAMRWAELGTQADEPYGVSLLNDCKYGYDAQPSQLRLTLLKGALWPNPSADLGMHEFTYALYPHAGNWQAAQTVRHGYELNQPLQVIFIEPGRPNSSCLPPIAEFLQLPSENLVLSALKQAEADDQWVLRCYECHGAPAAKIDWQAIGLLTEFLDVSDVETVNLLEEPIAADREILPWKITTYRLKRLVS